MEEEFGDILFAMIGTIGNPSMVTEDILISIKNVALFNISRIKQYLIAKKDKLKTNLVSCVLFLIAIIFIILSD